MASKYEKSIPRVKLEAPGDLRMPSLEYTDRWHETVKNIPVPYDGKSPTKATLLRISPKETINKMDESSIAALSKAADDTSTFYIKKYEGRLSKYPDKKKRAEELLGWAKFYLSEASKLERSWRKGFSAKSQEFQKEDFGQTMPWPLNVTWQKLNNGHCVQKGYGYKGKNKFDPSCPTRLEHIGHDADAKVLKNLLEAAARSIHGSREIAVLTHTYDVNKGKSRTKKVGGTRAAEREGPKTSSAASRASKEILLPPVGTPEIKNYALGKVNISGLPIGTGGGPVMDATFELKDEETGETGEDTLEDEDLIEDDDFQLSVMDEEVLEDPEELIDESDDPESDGAGYPDEDTEDSGPSKMIAKSRGNLIWIGAAAAVGILLLTSKK